tara:strand:+ start:3598 stop:3918 length:321 start_codon:yes stop_codon:yes gene_type:complete
MMDPARTPSGGVGGFRPHPALTESRALKSALAKGVLQVAPDNPQGLGKGQRWNGRYFPAGFTLGDVSTAIAKHLVSFEHDALPKAIGYLTHYSLLVTNIKYTSSGF